MTQTLIGQLKYEFRWLLKDDHCSSYEIDKIIDRKINNKVLQVRVVDYIGNSNGWVDVPTVIKDWRE